MSAPTTERGKNISAECYGFTRSGENFTIQNEGELIFNSNFEIADHFTNSGHVRVTGNGNTLLVSRLAGDTDTRFGANSVLLLTAMQRCNLPPEFL
jgi:hypothetical protein